MRYEMSRRMVVLSLVMVLVVLSAFSCIKRTGVVWKGDKDFTTGYNGVDEYKLRCESSTALPINCVAYLDKDDGLIYSHFVRGGTLEIDEASYGTKFVIIGKSVKSGENAYGPIVTFFNMVSMSKAPNDDDAEFHIRPAVHRYFSDEDKCHLKVVFDDFESKTPKRAEYFRPVLVGNRNCDERDLSLDDPAVIKAVELKNSMMQAVKRRGGSKLLD